MGRGALRVGAGEAAAGRSVARLVATGAGVVLCRPGVPAPGSGAAVGSVGATAGAAGAGAAGDP
ncbi:MAG: cytochrome c5 family protein, partial [Chloroflexota bacterium]